ncbi:MAG: mechanosensitive ion channel family protein [Deltaproteobacteria bacterium]|nr:mechanosensitive ion channel family protein [Deltaproteobacteria bacterium]
MSPFLDRLNEWVSHPLVIFALMAVFSLYYVLSKRSMALPKLPFGLFILYLAARLTWLIAGKIAPDGAITHWIYVAATILLAAAFVRLAYALLIEGGLKLFRRSPLPGITRDFILYACYAVVVLVVLRTHGGVNLAGLITTSAVLTAVIGLAAQNTLSGLFAGLALQLERNFNVGEWITFGDYTGEVIEISWQTTRLKTREGEVVAIPNVEITKAIFRNFSRPTRHHLARIDLGIHYDVPPNRVREVVLAVLTQHPRLLKAPAPEVRLVQFGDSAITYAAIFWVDDFADEPRIKAEMNQQLWYALRRNNITIPYPIRHLELAHVERRDRGRALEAQRADIIARLTTLSILAPLSDTERETLSQQALTVEGYGSGEDIVRQGEAGDSLYIILKGSCEVWIQTGGILKSIAVLQEGQYFGEMSLLTGAPRSATVRAKGDVSLLVIDKEDFRTVIATNPAVAGELAEVLAKRQAELAARAGERPAEDVSKGRLLTKIKAFFGVG